MALGHQLEDLAFSLGQLGERGGDTGAPAGGQVPTDAVAATPPPPRISRSITTTSGVRLTAPGHGVLASADRGDHLELAGQGEGGLQGVAEHRVVLGNQHPHHDHRPVERCCLKSHIGPSNLGVG